MFERLHYGHVQVMPYVGDKGRDLIIHDPHGTKIIVECKHHPSGTIGRPVIQKLHSAVITEKAVKGILVTTGKFSAEAIAHAKTINPPIQLVDMNLLRDMCSRAGIHLVVRGEKDSVFYFPVSNADNVAKLTVSTIMSRIVSRPGSPSSLFKLHRAALKLRPIYRIRYNVHQEFSKSVGVIHSIHLDDQELLLDGTTGAPIDRALKEFLWSTPTLDDTRVGESVHAARRDAFQLDQTTLTQKAKEIIANLHSKSVSYYGRNNVLYRTMCTPGERSILMSDVRQVYVPEWSISQLALSKLYRITIVEKPQDVLFLENPLSVCRVCNQTIAKGILLCNSCGNIAHTGNSHSYKCRLCEKSICRNCTHWTRRWIFFKAFLCEDCAVEKQRLRKKTRLLVVDQPKVECVDCHALIPKDAARCLKCLSDQPELRPSSGNVMNLYSEKAGKISGEAVKHQRPKLIRRYTFPTLPTLQEMPAEMRKRWLAWDLPYEDKEALTLGFIASAMLFLIGLDGFRPFPLGIGMFGLFVCYYCSNKERLHEAKKKLHLE